MTRNNDGGECGDGDDDGDVYAADNDDDVDGGVKIYCRGNS